MRARTRAKRRRLRRPARTHATPCATIYLVLRLQRAARVEIEDSRAASDSQRLPAIASDGSLFRIPRPQASARMRARASPIATTPNA